jgi:HEPN domain-containing protein
MRKRLDPADPREWLNRAKSSLRHSRSKAEGVYLEELCFDAQQAAEKAVKAVLGSRHVRFPHVHDLETLLTVLSENGVDVPDPMWEARKLTPYAVEARYPSVAKEVTEEQYAEAVRLAQATVDWAESMVTR